MCGASNVARQLVVVARRSAAIALSPNKQQNLIGGPNKGCMAATFAGSQQVEKRLRKVTRTFSLSHTHEAQNGHMARSVLAHDLAVSRNLLQNVKDICPHISVPQSWREQLTLPPAPCLKLATCLLVAESG